MQVAKLGMRSERTSPAVDEQDDNDLQVQGQRYGHIHSHTRLTGVHDLQAYKLLAEHAHAQNS